MYQHQRQTVDTFEITIGINKGYGHNNESTVDFEANYQIIATDIYNQTGVYVSGVITPAKVVYNVNWGCPMDGEDVYVIKDVKNPRNQGVSRFQSGEELVNSVGKINACYSL